ncbi:MAG TPA: c-type cytochrome [Candidatus Limnocylindrales bacterium]|nr:c-type cytochrome [Candidatus Limnocylindrales bacterium]
MVAFVLMIAGIMPHVISAAEGNPPAAGDPEHGKALFLRYCQGCHGPDGRGGAQTFMPHVDNLTRKGYIEKLSDEYLFQVISKGGAAMGKSAYMPAWEKVLQRQDILDVIAHIRKLPTY